MTPIIIALIAAALIPAIRRDGLRKMALLNQPDEHMTRATGDTYLNDDLLAAPLREQPVIHRVCPLTNPPYGAI